MYILNHKDLNIWLSIEIVSSVFGANIQNSGLLKLNTFRKIQEKKKRLEKNRMPSLPLFVQLNL